MTVSKTTTQEKARLLLSGYPESFVTEKEVRRYAEFADSLTAELQKENARLVKALEETHGYLCLGMFKEAYTECSKALTGLAALSKEYSRG